MISHSTLTLLLRLLGWTMLDRNPVRMARMWVHDDLDLTVLVPDQSAGDYDVRVWDLVGDLARAHDCPSDTVLRLHWLLRSVGVGPNGEERFPHHPRCRCGSCP